jgi:hypothetical protein
VGEVIDISASPLKTNGIFSHSINRTLKGNLLDVPKESRMLTARQAQHLTGIGAGQLLLLALTRQIPSQQDPDTRLVLFDPAILQEWTQANGRNLSTHPPTRQ